MSRENKVVFLVVCVYLPMPIKRFICGQNIYLKIIVIVTHCNSHIEPLYLFWFFISFSFLSPLSYHCLVRKNTFQSDFGWFTIDFGWYRWSPVILTFKRSYNRYGKRKFYNFNRNILHCVSSQTSSSVSFLHRAPPPVYWLWIYGKIRFVFFPPKPDLNPRSRPFLSLPLRTIDFQQNSTTLLGESTT